MTKAILLLAVTAAACQAGILYSNTTSDQQFSVFYSTGFAQIGDQLQLVSPGMLTSLDGQFYNVGSDATFDAVLRFYNIGAPVGSQIGSSFTVSNIFIASNTSQTVTFPDLGNIAVPKDVIVTLSVQNVSAGGDIGVNFFDPPTAGTSGNTFYIANNGANFSQDSTNLDLDNVYFQINGTAAPEPAATGMILGGLMMIALKFRVRS